MNLKRLSSAAAITATLAVSACSSSSDNDSTAQQQLTDAAQGSDNGQTSQETLADTNNNDANSGNSENESSVPDITPPTPSTSVDLRRISDSILLGLAGYELDVLSEQIGLIADGVVASSISINNLPDSIVELTDQSVSQSYPVSNIQYGCAQGGSLITSTLSVEVSTPEDRYSSETDSTTYVFDQCQFDADGDQSLNGSLTVYRRTASRLRESSAETTFTWQSLQWQQANGESVSITASISATSEFDGNSRDIRNASITEHTRSEGGVVESGFQNARLIVSNIRTEGGAIHDFTLDTKGDVIDPSGALVSVVSDPVMNSRFVESGQDQESVPFNGKITFSSSDGSSLEMVGNDTDSNGTRLTDIIYTDVNGNTSTSINRNLVELPVLQR